MPRCGSCGNKTVFGASSVSPIAPSANGPMSALSAQFGEDNHILQVTSLVSDKKIINKTLQEPSRYFDICLKCGSQEIIWDE